MTDRPRRGARRRTRVPTRLRLPQGPPSVDVDLVHPGPGEGFIGSHRRIEGGLLTADGALLVLPELVAGASTGDTLWLLLRQPPPATITHHSAGGLQLLRWQDGHLELVRELRASGVKLGATSLLAWRGTSVWREDLLGGQRLPLCVGAAEHRACPWSAGDGLSWLLGRALVEQADGRSSVVVGLADAPLQRLAAGPFGAAVVTSPRGIWTHAPGSGLSNCDLLEEDEDPLAPRQITFAPDGQQAMIETELGVALVELASGRVASRRLDGQPADAGWWVDPSGGRLRWRVEQASTDLPGPGVVIASVLHGPGGRAWDLRTGQDVGPALTAGADLATAWLTGLLLVEGSQIIAVNNDESRLCLDLDEDQGLALAAASRASIAAVRTSVGVAWGSQRPSSWRFAALALPSHGDLLTVNSRGLVAPHPDGDLVLSASNATARSLPVPSSPTMLAGCVALGLPLDGATQAPDGSTWAWQDDGPLLRLRP